MRQARPQRDERAVAVGDARADGDQRVHVGAAVPRRGPGRVIDRPRRPRTGRPWRRSAAPAPCTSIGTLSGRYISAIITTPTARLTGHLRLRSSISRCRSSASWLQRSCRARSAARDAFSTCAESTSRARPRRCSVAGYLFSPGAVTESTARLPCDSPPVRPPRAAGRRDAARTIDSHACFLGRQVDAGLLHAVDAASAFSMRRTQDAHVMPVTGNVTSVVAGLNRLPRWIYLRESSNSSPSSRIISSSRPSLKPVGTHEARWPSSSADSKALSARSTAYDCLRMSTQY